MTEHAPPADRQVPSELRARAAAHLERLAGEGSGFREHQLEAIADLVEDRARVLCVQRTGWGKSAVYFVATALLREQGAGPTLIVSPLLALMRGQVEAARRLGLSAHTMNSSNRDAWDEIDRLLTSDDVDLLLVSPERLAHPRFRNEMLPRFANRVGLLVIDEAHCISDWGHDFRPDYRRIREMLEELPEQVGVLCTTATANDRVVDDVLEQLAAGATEPAELRTYRGGLMRDSLRLETVDLPGRADRLAWLAENLPELPGSGIVYTLTKADAELVADWLNEQGISAATYSGDVDAERREEVEAMLQGNQLKAVVATSALGMGYDKPDLGFVVHLQSPGSIVAYYQQVGRAGRGLDHAEAVLLRGAEDARIQDHFILQAFPPRSLVESVLEEITSSPGGLTAPDLLARVRIGRARLTAMLKVLEVEGGLARAGSRYVIGDADWAYDAERYDQVTALRRTEQAAMAAYGSDGRCLMRTLAEELDDPDPGDCGRCSVCTAPRWNEQPATALVREAGKMLRSRPVTLEVKKMAPDATTGSMKKIPASALAEPGRALARLGDEGWDPLIAEGAKAGRFDDELAGAAAELVRSWGAQVAWVASVPSTRSGDRVSDLASRIAERLGLQHHAVVHRVEDRPPQREMPNTPAQVANVRGAFAVDAELPEGPCLLVDDYRHSGWTLAMIAGQLRGRGCPAVHPLALASAV